jgi:uncharacterized protein
LPLTRAIGFVVLAAIGLALAVVGALEVYVHTWPPLYDPPRTYVPPGEVASARGFQEFPVATFDGLSLRGWYVPATTKPYTLLFFHGSGDGLVKAVAMTAPFVHAGYGVLLAEYRGYSGEPGTPSEEGLYKDGRAYLRGLEARGITTDRVVLYGYSLGTGVAVKLATETPVAGLMLLAPYLSINKVMQHRHRWLPVDLFVRDRFQNAAAIADVHCPLLIGHGTVDKIVPTREGEALFALANPPKTLKLLDGFGHLNAFDAFAKVAIPWLEKLPAPPGADRISSSGKLRGAE